MLAILLIPLALGLLLLIKETHRHFSRTAFWSVVAAVIAANVMLYVTGCSLELIDLPGLLVVGPFLPFTAAPIVNFAFLAAYVAISALAYAYTAGRIVGAIGARRSRARRAAGACSNCGYDLTGNISGVCPECGTRIQ